MVVPGGKISPVTLAPSTVGTSTSKLLHLPFFSSFLDARVHYLGCFQLILAYVRQRENIMVLFAIN